MSINLTKTKPLHKFMKDLNDNDYLQVINNEDKLFFILVIDGEKSFGSISSNITNIKDTKSLDISWLIPEKGEPRWLIHNRIQPTNVVLTLQGG